MTEKRSDSPKPAEAEKLASKPDALQEFLAGQARKCRAHHRESTAEVMELIRKHRKG